MSTNLGFSSSAGLGADICVRWENSIESENDPGGPKGPDVAKDICQLPRRRRSRPLDPCPFFGLYPPRHPRQAPAEAPADLARNARSHRRHRPNPNPHFHFPSLASAPCPQRRPPPPLLHPRRALRRHHGRAGRRARAVVQRGARDGSGEREAAEAVLRDLWVLGPGEVFEVWGAGVWGGVFGDA